MVALQIATRTLTRATCLYCIGGCAADSHSHSDSSDLSSTLTNEETSWDETSPEVSVTHRRLKRVCLTPPSGSSTTSPDGNDHEERDEEVELAVQRKQGAIPKRVASTSRRKHHHCECVQLRGQCSDGSGLPCMLWLCI